MITPHLIMEGAQNRTLLVLFCSLCFKLIENFKMTLIVINTKQKKLQARSSVRFGESYVSILQLIQQMLKSLFLILDGAWNKFCLVLIRIYNIFN